MAIYRVNCDICKGQHNNWCRMVLKVEWSNRFVTFLGAMRCYFGSGTAGCRSVDKANGHPQGTCTKEIKGYAEITDTELYTGHIGWEVRKHTAIHAHVHAYTDLLVTFIPGL